MFQAANLTVALTAKQVDSFLHGLDGIMQAVVYPTFVETTLWGMFTLLVIISSYVLARWGVRTTSSRLIFALTILMYVMATVMWVASLIILRDGITLAIPAELLPPSPSTVRAIQGVVHLILASAIPQNINIIVGDGMMLWRACVVWARNKIVVGISLILGLLTAGFYTSFTIVQLTGQSVLPQNAFLGTTAFSLSLISNSFATAMIAFKFWQHRMHIKKELRSRSMRSAMEGSFILLTETGVIYVALWALYFAADSGVTMGGFGPTIAIAMQQVTGMYPTLLVVIIAFQKSKIDRHVGTSITSEKARPTSELVAVPVRPPLSPVSVILIGNPPDTGSFYSIDLENRPLPPLPSK